MDSLQRRYAPDNRCFGCGPANEHGLRIDSFEEGDAVVARFRPQPYHVAFGNVLNGGICGALLDCNSNWAAAMHLLRRDGGDELPSTVTGDFHVVLKRPTPIDGDVVVRSHVVESDGPRVVVEATKAGEMPVSFVAVEAGHPAHHRWQ